VNPGETYDPLLILNPFQTVDEGFLSLETWIVFVCHSEGEWARQYLSAFERGMVVGARRTGLC
jgi:hypothetical protein